MKSYMFAKVKTFSTKYSNKDVIKTSLLRLSLLLTWDHKVVSDALEFQSLQTTFSSHYQHYLYKISSSGTFHQTGRIWNNR